MNRQLANVLCACALAACAGGTAGTTTGGSVTTGGSIGGSGGSSGGLTCLTTTCTADSQCITCGTGYLCSPYNGFCCGNYGTECSASTDCCSAYCDANTLLCANQPGGSVSGTTSGVAAASGTTGGVTTSGAAATTVGASSTTAGGSGTTGTTSAGTTGTAVGTTSSSGTTGGGFGPTFTFTWTFGLSQACEQANVAWIALTLNSGSPIILPCRDRNGVEGATVDASLFSGAEVNYALTAYDGVAGQPVGQVSGSAPAPLQGTTAVPVTLAFATGANQSSTLDIDWTFNGLTATQAGIATVRVQLTDPPNMGNNVDETLDAGLNNGVSLPGFGPASYPITLTGSGLATFTGSATLAANGITPAVLLADLPVSSSGSAGNVVIDFGFIGGSCAAAGFDTVSLQLARANGAVVAGPVNLPCADAGTSYVFSGLTAPSTAFLWLEGVSQGQTQQLANPQIAISPGATATYAVTTEPPP